MFYTDLSNYQYKLPFELNKVKNTGWLEKNSSFKQGSIDQIFLKKLFEIIKHKEFNIYRGTHDCDFCSHDGFIYAFIENDKIFLGHGKFGYHLLLRILFMQVQP